MPRGYRRYIIAAVGSLGLLAIGAGAERASVWINGPDSYPAYRESAEPKDGEPFTLAEAKGLQTIKEKQPCRDQAGSNDSELCASWRAADAAEKAARWAWLQMVFSLAGVLGLGATLWFNLEAWRQAESSGVDTSKALAAAERNAEATAELVLVSQHNAEKQLRAYLDFDEVKPVRLPERDEKEAICCGYSYVIRNYGHTPARDVTRTTIYATFSKEMDRRDIGDVLKSVGDIAPGDHVTVHDHFFMRDYEWQAIEKSLLTMMVDIMVNYHDVFDGEQSLHCTFQTSGGDRIGFVPGTKRAT